MGKTEIIPSKIRKETRISTIPSPIQHVLEFLTRAIKQEEEIKGIETGKKLSKYPYLQIICFCTLKTQKIYPKTPRHHQQL
jgi:hypothetical protein